MWVWKRWPRRWKGQFEGDREGGELRRGGGVVGSKEVVAELWGRGAAGGEGVGWWAGEIF